MSETSRFDVFLMCLMVTQDLGEALCWDY